LIDENVSENVKLIFSMYLDGYTQGQIARHLTSLEIDTPKKYKGEKCKINEWRNDSIGRILEDPTYTGKIITNKYDSDYRTKKKKKTPKENWILVPGRFEPIISEEDFEKVQQKRKNINKGQKEKYDYLLRGLVHCGHCKSRLQYKYRTRTKIRDKYLENPQKSWYYKCRMLYRFPSICDKGHTIMENKLNEIVLTSLKKRLALFKIDECTGKVIDEYKSKNSNFKLLEQYQKKKNKLEVNITTLYNRKLEGLISVEEFKEQYPNLKLELKETEKQIEELESICNASEINGKLKDIILDFKNGKEFDNETIRCLIDRIEVYEDMRIDITYKI